MKKTFPLLLLLALSNNYIAQNADNVLNDTLIKQHTTVFTQTSTFSNAALSSAIGIKYIGFGASILGANILINSDPNSYNTDEEDKIKLGKILTIGGGVLAGLGQIIQDLQTLRLGRDYSNYHTKTSNTSFESTKQGLNSEIIDDEFDGRYLHDRKHFSLFKVIKVRDVNTKDSAVLISFWLDGSTIEIWINPNSEKLVWDKKKAE